MTPSVVGFYAMAASSDVSRLTDYRYEFVPDARRFEPGTHAFHDLAGMAASIELLLEVGIDRIADHVTRLLAPFEAWLAGHPEIEIVSDRSPERRSAIFCFRPPRLEAAMSALQAAGVRCALREGSIRISPHLYNTPADIDRLIDGLERHLRD